MATPPLLALPTSFPRGEYVMGFERVTGVSENPFNKKTDAFEWSNSGGRFFIDFSIGPVVDPIIAAEWKAFGMRLKGRFGNLLLGDPSARVPNGVATGTPKIKGGGQTGGSIITDGWTASTVNIMMAGDYIQLGTGTNTKLYMVTANVNSNGLGEATIGIEPNLRLSPSDNADIITHDTVGLFRLEDDNFKWIGKPPYHTFSFAAYEVL